MSEVVYYLTLDQYFEDWKKDFKFFKLWFEKYQSCWIPAYYIDDLVKESAGRKIAMKEFLPDDNGKIKSERYGWRVSVINYEHMSFNALTPIDWDGINVPDGGLNYLDYCRYEKNKLAPLINPPKDKIKVCSIILNKYYSSGAYISYSKLVGLLDRDIYHVDTYEFGYTSNPYILNFTDDAVAHIDKYDIVFLNMPIATDLKRFNDPSIEPPEVNFINKIKSVYNKQIYCYLGGSNTELKCYWSKSVLKCITSFFSSRANQFNLLLSYFKDDSEVNTDNLVVIPYQIEDEVLENLSPIDNSHFKNHEVVFNPRLTSVKRPIIMHYLATEMARFDKDFKVTYAGGNVGISTHSFVTSFLEDSSYNYEWLKKGYDESSVKTIFEKSVYSADFTLQIIDDVRHVVGMQRTQMESIIHGVLPISSAGESPVENGFLELSSELNIFPFKIDKINTDIFRFEAERLYELQHEEYFYHMTNLVYYLKNCFVKSDIKTYWNNIVKNWSLWDRVTDGVNNIINPFNV